jgi:DedD protein
MDRSLKARLIGASVLVLLVVLVVPELLSGPKTATPTPPTETTGNGQMRTYTIELGDGAASASTAPAPRAIEPVSPPPDERGASATVATVSTDGTADPTRSGAPDRPATKNAAVRPPAAEVDERMAPQTASAASAAAGASTPVRGTWSVQVGAFGSADSARRLVDKLEADGFSAYVSEGRRDAKTLYRVRVGPEAERVRVDALAGRLKARGLPVSIVAND